MGYPYVQVLLVLELLVLNNYLPMLVATFLKKVAVSRAERKCTGWPEQKCTTRCQRKGPEGPFLSI